jgi:hypothetical protein
MDPARAREALASFYDGRAGKVREYCATVCPAEFVDEATFAAFRDFLGRMGNAGPDTDVDDLLWKATRGAAAGRAEVREAGDPQHGGFPQPKPTEPGATCLAMPELIAAYVSGELPRNSKLDRHLVECPVCRRTAKRFREAEGAFSAEPHEQPPEAIRRAWLEIATSEHAAERP